MQVILFILLFAAATYIAPLILFLVLLLSGDI